MRVDDLSASVNVDFSWNARNLPLRVFGQQLEAQTTPGSGHTNSEADTAERLGKTKGV